jgi:adenylosuccinate synthase
MAHAIVIGAQWGDEGKGKIVDLLCPRVDAVVRFQGGPNAGHTVSVSGKKTFLHHIPSGILHAGKICILGNGMVIDPDGFLKEVEALRAAGLDPEGRLFLSDRAQIIFPHHRQRDVATEDGGAQHIGTTRRGVGPTYQAKVIRVGLRGADLNDPAELTRRLKAARALDPAWPAGDDGNLETIQARALDIHRRLAPYLDDTVVRLQDLLDSGGKVLFEGSQGTLLDVDHGTYPYVTSSNTVAGAACAGAGVGPNVLQGAIGVFKAYATRVGEGPMPTEETGAVGDTIRERGNEYGTTTGRPRRCGWFDAVAGRHAVRVNGLKLAALTLLDVLDTLDSIQVAVAYETPAGRIQHMPASVSQLAAARPVYETLPGWGSDTTACRSWQDLPAAAQALVERLEALIGVRFAVISVGPDREQTIIRDAAALDALFA